MILYMLVVGRLPFSEANDSETLTKIMDCQYKVPTSLSPECQRLVKRLLVKEPQGRLSMDDIINDDWFGNGNIFSIKFICLFNHIDGGSRLSRRRHYWNTSVDEPWRTYGGRTRAHNRYYDEWKNGNSRRNIEVI